MRGHQGEGGQREALPSGPRTLSLQAQNGFRACPRGSESKGLGWHRPDHLCTMHKGLRAAQVTQDMPSFPRTLRVGGIGVQSA